MSGVKAIMAAGLKRRLAAQASRHTSGMDFTLSSEYQFITKQRRFDRHFFKPLILLR
jgi:hypothetical protein